MKEKVGLVDPADDPETSNRRLSYDAKDKVLFSL